MKKPILVLAGLLMFAGIASASVDSDTMQIRYQKCIQDLAVLDSLNYMKPSEADAAAMHVTYTEELARWQNNINYREAKRSECKSLSGTAPVATVKPQTTPKVAQASGAYQFVPQAEAADPIATHPVILHIEKTINRFWIIFGLMLFLMLVITWKVFRKDK